MNGLTALVLVSLFTGCLSAWQNDKTKNLKFQCPPNEYITRWKSKYDGSNYDRQFDFDCKPGLVGKECKWSSYANGYDQFFSYQCPDDHIVTGAESTFDTYYNDRKWKFRCCKITGKSGTGCDHTDWANEWGKDGDYILEDGQAMSGVLAVHSNSWDDRRFWFNVCKFTTCTAKKIKIIDDIKPTNKGMRQVGFATAQGCTPGKEYTLILGKTDTVEETSSITLTEGTEFNYGTEISVEATASAGFLGNGGSVTMGVSQSFGGAITAEKETTKETMTGRESSAEIESSYEGPAAVLILAEVTEFVIDKSDVNVAIDVECDDGTKFTKKSKMAFSSKSYSQTHFTMQTGKFSKPENCDRTSNNCIRSINGAHAPDPYKIIDEFKECFKGKGKVTK